MESERSPAGREPSADQHAERRRIWGAELAGAAVVALLLVSIQKLLFPLESYWQAQVAGLAVFAIGRILAERLLGLRNPFGALDEGSLRARDTFPLLALPPALAASISATGRGGLNSILLILWVACALQTSIAAVFVRWGRSLSTSRATAFRTAGRGWTITVVLVVLVYGAVFFSVGTEKPVNPLLTGDPTVRGIWFTIPVQKSELFPSGYGRLEDSVYDDLGRVFVAGVGQTVGLVEACKTPGPDLGRAMPSANPGGGIQPKFYYAVDAMCPEWLSTLPALFWRIGLLGVLGLALSVGIGVLQNPGQFAVMAMILLLAWRTWPEPDLIRTGNVAMLVAGMPLVVVLFPILRRGLQSRIFIWGLVSGVGFGLAGFVRRPCGTALLISSILVLILAGISWRKTGAALLGILALLIGASLVPAMMNGLFAYRDARLQITAPKSSPIVHGAGWNLLGGIGGEPAGTAGNPAPQYNNALDMAFRDGLIWYGIYDRNPLIGLSQRSISLMQQVGLQMYEEYILEHPVEFMKNLIRKLGWALNLTLTATTNWPVVSLILAGALGLRYPQFRTSRVDAEHIPDAAKWIAGAFLLLAAAIAVPAVLTAPDYGELTQPVAAVLLITLIVSVHTFVAMLTARLQP